MEGNLVSLKSFPVQNFKIEWTHGVNQWMNLIIIFYLVFFVAAVIRDLKQLRVWCRRLRQRKVYSKYNNCTLKCIELGTCTELLLKITTWKDLCLEFSGLQGRNCKNFLIICLASWRNIPSFSVLFTKFKAKKQDPNDQHRDKRATQKCDFSEPSSFAFPSSLLKVLILNI